MCDEECIDTKTVNEIFSRIGALEEEVKNLNLQLISLAKATIKFAEIMNREQT